MLCSNPLNGTMRRWAVTLAFDPKKGGEATFLPLPPAASVLRASDALVTQPKIPLGVTYGGGAGSSSKPFDVPPAATGHGADGPVQHVTSFRVDRLRAHGTGWCSDVEMEAESVDPPTGAAVDADYTGRCVYLALADGSPPPPLERGEIANCAP